MHIYMHAYMHGYRYIHTGTGEAWDDHEKDAHTYIHTYRHRRGIG